jgi:hypothetical protein
VVLFGPKGDEIGECRKELRDLSDIITIIKSKRMVWTGTVALVGETRDTYRILVRKRKGKRTLGKPRCKCVDNTCISTALREIECGGVS